MNEQKTLREAFLEAIYDEFAKRGVNTNVKNLSWDEKTGNFLFESEPINMTPRVFKTLYVYSRSLYYEKTSNKDIYKVTILFDYRWKHFDKATNGTRFVAIDMYVNTNPEFTNAATICTY